MATPRTRATRRTAPPKKPQPKPRQRRKRAPAALPDPATLWPDRLAGLSERRAIALMIKASAQAAQAFRMRRLPQKDEVKPLDPIAAIVAADAEIVRLIGAPAAAREGAVLPSAFKIPRVEKGGRADRDDEEEAEDRLSPWPDKEAPSWISVEHSAPGFAAIVRIGFRGARIVSPKRSRAGLKARHYKVGQESYVHWSAGFGVDAVRLYSFDALQEAHGLARQALQRAGCVLSPLGGAAQAHGGESATAAIYIRRLSPALTRGPSMAR